MEYMDGSFAPPHHPFIARSTFSRSSRVAAICFEAPVCRCTATILVTGVCLVMQWRDTSELAKKKVTGCLFVLYVRKMSESAQSTGDKIFLLPFFFMRTSIVGNISLGLSEF
jgi:hypothetical protein